MSAVRGCLRPLRALVRRVLERTRCRGRCGKRQQGEQRSGPALAPAPAHARPPRQGPRSAAGRCHAVHLYASVATSPSCNSARSPVFGWPKLVRWQAELLQFISARVFPSFLRLKRIWGAFSGVFCGVPSAAVTSRCQQSIINNFKLSSMKERRLDAVSLAAQPADRTCRASRGQATNLTC